MPRPPTFVLGYHNMLPTSAFAGDAPQLPIFREQLRTLARRCEVVPLDQDESPDRGRRPTLALTFDDGYLDNATLLADLLTDLELPATFFLVTSFLDGTDYPWWEVVSAILNHPGVTAVELGGRRLDMSSAGLRDEARRYVAQQFVAADIARRDQLLLELRDTAGPAGAEAAEEVRASAPMMTWDQARALRDAGFTIGSHTDRHPILAREDAGRTTAELTRSRHRLETELGTSVTTFAYPNGAAADFTDTSVRLVREAGYRVAVSTVPGVNGRHTDPLRVHRLILEPHLSTSAVALSATTQLGGSAARRLFSLARGGPRALRTARPSS